MVEQTKKRIVIQDMKLAGFGSDKSTSEEPTNTMMKEIAQVIQGILMQNKIQHNIFILGMTPTPDQKIAQRPQQQAQQQQRPSPNIPLRRPQPQQPVAVYDEPEGLEDETQFDEEQ